MERGILEILTRRVRYDMLCEGENQMFQKEEIWYGKQFNYE